jgi:hypothetical protein
MLLPARASAQLGAYYGHALTAPKEKLIKTFTYYYLCDQHYNTDVEILNG